MIGTLTCAILIFALPLRAAELTGTWEGSLEIVGPNGQTQANRCYMKVKQSGTRITGAIGPDKTVQWSIQNGKAEGTRITFDVSPPEGGRLTFDLRLAGVHLRGQVRGENRGLTMEAKVHMTRTAK
jgi:hypothetical protein